MGSLNIKSYFDKELTATTVFAVLGLIIGYVSFLLNNPPVSFLVMIIAAGIFVFLLKKILKVTEEFKWWLGNGLVVYIFLWLIIWTIFYNVALR